MRTKKYRYVEDDGGGYDLSISDLMAALCCIFVLLCVSLSAPLAKNTFLAYNYGVEEEKVYKELKELQPTLKEIKAEIVPNTLAIRFSGDDSFAGNNADLNPVFKQHLNIIFPKFIQILRRHEDLIDEVKIEGHAALDLSSYDNTRNYLHRDYIDGMAWSEKRTKIVFDYCVNRIDTLSIDDRDWAKKHIVLSNYSNSRYIWEELNDKERNELSTFLDKEIVSLLDAELDSQTLGEIYRDYINKKDKFLNSETFQSRQNVSRRVEFRVKTHSDELMRQLQAMLGMEVE